MPTRTVADLLTSVLPPKSGIGLVPTNAPCGRPTQAARWLWPCRLGALSCCCSKLASHVHDQGQADGGHSAMNKTSRLLRLMQVLRGRQRPVTAQQLAERLSVSVRTVYRDIQALVDLGAAIDGSAGVGYLLRSGFFLPSLMFSDDEIEALVLGARWVEAQGDTGLAQAADTALAKIATSSPKDLREKIAEIGLWAPRRAKVSTTAVDLAVLRAAIRQEHKIQLQYLDARAEASERVVWPMVLGFFEGTRVLAAWCEQRGAFRHFRVDRMVSLHTMNTGYPTSRRELVKAWKTLGLSSRPGDR